MDKFLSRFLAIFLLSASFMQPELLAQNTDAVQEAQVKIAFIYNFAKYTSWNSAGGQQPGEFGICLTGKDDLLPKLGSMIESRSIGGHPVRVQVRDYRNLGDCQLIYFSGLSLQQAEVAAYSVRNKPVLTVSDTPGQAVLTMYRDGENLRFDVDLGRLKGSGLVISSQLLRLARSVTGM